MSDFDPGILNRPRLLAELAPDQDIEVRDGLQKIRCPIPGCDHANGDRDRSASINSATGYLKCYTSGAEFTHWKATVCALLGEDRWRRALEDAPRSARATGPSVRTTPANARTKPRPTREQIRAAVDGMRPEGEWARFYRLDPALAHAHLAQGGRPWFNADGTWGGDPCRSVVLLYDGDSLAGLKFRQFGDRKPKYVLQAAQDFNPNGYLFRPGSFWGERVLLCAGEKDALVAASHLDPDRWSPCSGIQGEGTVAGFGDALAGRDVVIAFDDDKAGRNATAKAVRELQGKVRTVLVAPAWGDDCNDLADFWHRWGDEKLAEVLEQASEPVLEQLPASRVEAHPADVDEREAKQIPDLAEGLPAYPLDVWPASWRAVIDEASACSLTDPCMAASALSAALGSCLGRPWQFKVRERDRSMSCRPLFWGVILAPSTAGKSMAASPVLKAIEHINADIAESHKIDHEQWKALPAKGDDAIAHQGNTDEPRLRMILAHDTTVEGLAQAFHVDSEQGMLVIADEVSGWMASMDAYRTGGAGKDRAAWLSMFDGGGLVHQRAGGHRIARHTHVCMHGGLQPERLAGLGLQHGDGLFSRLMWTVAPKRTQHGMGRDFCLHDTLVHLLKMARELGQPRSVTVDPGVMDRLDEFYVQQSKRGTGCYYDEGRPLRSTVETRSIVYLQRVVGLLAGADAIDRGGDPDVHVTHDLLERAFALVEFYRAHGLRAVGALLNPPTRDEAGAEARDVALVSQLLKACQQGPLEASAGDLARRVGGGWSKVGLGRALRRLGEATPGLHVEQRRKAGRRLWYVAAT